MDNIITEIYSSCSSASIVGSHYLVKLMQRCPMPRQMTLSFSADERSSSFSSRADMWACDITTASWGYSWDIIAARDKPGAASS